jgi:tyrosyl-tRNA synthetase
MWRYFEVLSFRPLGDIAKLKRSVEEGRNPRDVKFELAQEIVERFHDRNAATREKAEFVSRFQKGEMPEAIAEVRVSSSDGKLGIAYILKEAGLVSSTSEAFRMLEQGAVRIDGDRVDNRGLEVPAGTSHVFQVGKRKFARVLLS